MAALFNPVSTPLYLLLPHVKSGEIGLPELQRPFVWPDSKVRNLFDSMMKGYPIGYVMIWKASTTYTKTAQIGTGSHLYDMPSDLVIDGQQRLTGLLSAMYKDQKVKDIKYNERRIRIAFNPLRREFDVWSKAKENSPEWIDDIADVFEYVWDGKGVSYYRPLYLSRLRAFRDKKSLPTLTLDDEATIEKNLNDLVALKDHPLPVMWIEQSADVEQVAEIFVRVNSGGKVLNEKNFIETVLSVYDSEAKKLIDDFCEQSRCPVDGTSYNTILPLLPVHLIRMAVGVAFWRARLKFAHKLLRGENMDDHVVTAEEREKNLALFKAALRVVTNVNDWHAFLQCFKDAGYLNHSLVASDNAVVFCYVMFLKGKYDFKVPPVDLAKLIRRWAFVSTITGYYTNSVETDAETQLKELLEIDPKTPAAFTERLNRAMESRFTDSYFSVTLPEDLQTSGTQSPVWLGFVASQIILDAHILFGTQLVQGYLLPGASGKKKAVDIHHIFPRNFLENNGYQDKDRLINQVANFVYLNYATNIDVSDDAPSVYSEKYKAQIGVDAFLRSCEENAIPANFGELPYEEFLAQRRRLMAQKIKMAYEKLSR